MISKGVFFIGEYMKTLITARLILRDLTLNDLDAFYQYAKKPIIGPMAGWTPHKSLEESYRILKMMKREKEVWALTLKTSDLLIGTIGLHVRTVHNAFSNRREIGYVLDDPYWGRGLMAEAVLKILEYGFTQLELDEITCGHTVLNRQSKRVIEKVGFTYDKMEKREDSNKEKIDVLMYKMSKDKYKELMINDKLKT